MQIVVLIPLTHPSCMTGQPAPLSVCLKDSCPNQTFCQQHWQESAPFLCCSCPWETAAPSENSPRIAHGIHMGVLQRDYWQFLSEQGKKPHNVRLRTSRFLYNLLNICSWSRDMAKVKVWGFFFFFLLWGFLCMFWSLKITICFEMHLWLQ